MNWKKFTIGITLVNILGWILIEIWSVRYAESNISSASAWLIALHLILYYIISIICQLPEPELTKEKIGPHNCPGHDWQPYKYASYQEQCVICGAERGKHDKQ